ncbi:MAG: N-formylglutamate amidohydrolase [Balneolaceae bacterium]|nr:N-formylglutamate amidohydrolase [Balneolaceae bacterium]MCH8548592.1 N-formylglutamate amidohydrolase [Balneolaceae bacterium]
MRIFAAHSEPEPRLYPDKMAILLTCEHAGNQIPEAYNKLFIGKEEVLASHRGWDPGAFSIAKKLSSEWGSPLLSYSWSRLLIEPNRSEGHPELFSEFTSGLGESEKTTLLDHYYRPYRKRIENLIQKQVSEHGFVIHCGIHTFTPLFNGAERDVDIGILFDPDRPAELEICTRWKRAVESQFSGLRISFNEPYAGSSDGLTTTLRQKLSNSSYAGIELEFSQAVSGMIIKEGFPIPPNLD